MVVFKRKTRMLSFRLSEEEYQRLRQSSVVQGARSVSDHARDTLFHVLSGDAVPPPNGLENKVTKLDSEMQVLSRDLERLRRFLGFDAPQ